MEKNLKVVFNFLVFEEPEDPTNRSFFSEIISSISDVKFSNSGRYMISRDYLSVKVWDLHMETKPIETYTVSISVKSVHDVFSRTFVIEINSEFFREICASCILEDFFSFQVRNRLAARLAISLFATTTNLLVTRSLILGTSLTSKCNTYSKNVELF